MQTRITFLSFLIGSVALGAPVSRVTNFVDGNVLTAGQLNSEFNNVLSGVNSVNNAQIAVGANVDPAKISSSIKGSAIDRDAGTGALSVKPDDVSIEIDGDNLAIKAEGVDTAQLADASVTSEKLGLSAVQETNIQDGAVTQAKLASKSLSNARTVSLSTSSTSWVYATGTVVNLVTTGRPVAVGLRSVGGGSSMGAVSVMGANVASVTGVLRVEASAGGSTYPWGETIQSRVENGSGTADPAVTVPCSAFFTVYQPNAASIDFRLMGQNIGSGQTLNVVNCELYAYEL